MKNEGITQTNLLKMAINGGGHRKNSKESPKIIFIQKKKTKLNNKIKFIGEKKKKKKKKRKKKQVKREKRERRR